MNQDSSYAGLGQRINSVEERASQMSSQAATDGISEQLSHYVFQIESHIKKIKNLFQNLISPNSKNSDEENEEKYSIEFSQIDQEIQWIDVRLKNLQFEMNKDKSIYNISDCKNSPFYFLELERLEKSKNK